MLVRVAIPVGLLVALDVGVIVEPGLLVALGVAVAPGLLVALGTAVGCCGTPFPITIGKNTVFGFAVVVVVDVLVAVDVVVALGVSVAVAVGVFVTSGAAPVLPVKAVGPIALRSRAKSLA